MYFYGIRLLKQSENWGCCSSAVPMDESPLHLINKSVGSCCFLSSKSIIVKRPLLGEKIWLLFFLQRSLAYLLLLLFLLFQIYFIFEINIAKFKFSKSSKHWLYIKNEKWETSLAII